MNFEFGWQLLFFNAFALGAPLILAAMGGLISERSGVVNIALEGIMLTGACVASLIGQATENALLGLIGGILGAVIISLLHALLTQAYRVNHIVSGIAVNLIAIGGTSYLAEKLANTAHLGDITSFSVTIYTYIAICSPIIIALYLRYTRGGLHLLAIGSDPIKAREMGINPIKVRYLALAVTGLLCGLAGVTIFSNAGRFSDNMTAGRGFIALAAVILGSWRPIPIGIVCVLFGMLSSLDLQLQGTNLFGATLPSQFWNSLPYVATVIAMAGLLGKNKAPAGIGKH